MARRWNEVTREHVFEAIRQYDENPSSYTQARHTFRIHGGKRYPAKAIRGIAYEVCHGEKISQHEFSGGAQTAQFFSHLGCEVESGGTSVVSATAKPMHRARQRSRHLDRTGQKNALEALLQKHFGIIMREKSFDWLRVPAPSAFDQTYQCIHDSLCKYRGHGAFAKYGRRLQADFYVESLNLIIEYDENQHFSRARRISLQNYPNDVRVGFSVSDWIEACERTNAVDNEPPDRDEARAFYDSVRDIEIPRHGMRILRIRHGDVDWDSAEAGARLLDLLMPYVRRPVQGRAASIAPAVAGHLAEWRALEVGFQRIRLNYLKWFFHFTPPGVDPTNRCGHGPDFKLLNTHNGTGFTVFPCGLGSVYVGGGRGCVGLPETCFAPVSCLMDETAHLKESLSRLTSLIKDAMITALHAGDSDSTWRMMLDYWWLKLGLHEFAYDVTYETDSATEWPTTDIRDFVLTAMSRGRTASHLHTMRFDPAQVEQFIRHRITWNRFACCSFDCGPIAVGKDRFVSYEEIAAVRSRFFAGCETSSMSEDEKRVLAKQALECCCDFLAVYYERPLTDMFHYSGFEENRESLVEVIAQTQDALNGIVESERLDLPTFTYVPR